MKQQPKEEAAVKHVLYLQGQRPTKWSLAPAGCWRWPPATSAKELGLECATGQVGLMELVQCEGLVSGYDPPFSYFLHLLWGVSAPREAALTDGRTELAKQEGRWGNLGSPCRSLQWFSEPWAYFFFGHFALSHLHLLLHSGIWGSAVQGAGPWGKAAGIALWGVGRSSSSCPPGEHQLLPPCRGVGVAGKSKLMPDFRRWRLG